VKYLFIVVMGISVIIFYKFIVKEKFINIGQLLWAIKLTFRERKQPPDVKYIQEEFQWRIIDKKRKGLT